MINYPANLPQPIDSLTGQSATPVIRTDMDTGLVVQQGRFATGRSTYQLSWKLDQAEKIIFEEWFNETLSGGVLLFALQMLVDGGIDDVPARFVDGQYDCDHLAGMWFEISATVEILLVTDAPANRTPAVAPWFRLSIDEALSQIMDLNYRNARMITRPALANLTTLRIPPPVGENSFIWFGVQNFGAGDVLITSVDVDPVPVEATPNFPAELPAVENSFSENAKRGTERLDMESGHSRQWSRFETTVKTFNASWQFSLEELQSFRDFFYTTLKAGSKVFTLKLPVDGGFADQAVRFTGGTFKEGYVPVGRFNVAAELEQVVGQTVAPYVLDPHPLYHAPIVSVYANRKITSGDGLKMFEVYPIAGQTINLHIYSRTFEIGVTVKGLGNVLITRGPFLLSVGSFSERASTSFPKTSLELRSLIRELGTIASESAPYSFPRPTVGVLSTIKPLGTIASESAPYSFPRPPFEIKAVLENLGALTPENEPYSFPKATITIDIP